MIKHRIACPCTWTNWSYWKVSSSNCWNRFCLISSLKSSTTLLKDAFQIATYIINHLPMKILNNQSSFENAYNKKLNYAFMHIFVCACWPILWPYNHHKIDFWSKIFFFVGYSLSHWGCRCLDLSTVKFYVSQHVIFD